jgi:CRP/FNR family transcriptional regulator
MNWVDTISAGGSCPISGAASSKLSGLPQLYLKKGTVLFRPGDGAEGFLVVLTGRIEVHLTGAAGREILLYAVEAGQSCVQTTLGLMGNELYTGQASASSDVRIVVIPRALFGELMDDEKGFRSFVLLALGRRIHDVTRILEQVAFESIESRLARALLDLSQEGLVKATQAELATRIGSAREVVTRRLDTFKRLGWVETDRGTVRLIDCDALTRASLTWD